MTSPLTVAFAALYRCLDRLSNLSNAVGSAMILLIMLLMCGDVLSRNLFLRPLPVVAELVAAILVVVVFLQLACAVRNGRLARTDMLLAVLEVKLPWLANGLHFVFHLLGMGICTIITVQTWPHLAKAWSRDEFLGLVGVFTLPIWPFFLAVTFGAALAALQFLSLALRMVPGMKAAKADASPLPSDKAE